MLSIPHFGHRTQIILRALIKKFCKGDFCDSSINQLLESLLISMLTFQILFNFESKPCPVYGFVNPMYQYW